MEELLALLIIMAVLLFLFMFAYRKRHFINRWLNDPASPNAYVVDRKTILRRRIEDSEREIEALDEIETHK